MNFANPTGNQASRDVPGAERRTARATRRGNCSSACASSSNRDGGGSGGAAGVRRPGSGPRFLYRYTRSDGCPRFAGSCPSSTDTAASSSSASSASSSRATIQLLVAVGAEVRHRRPDRRRHAREAGALRRAAARLACVGAVFRYLMRRILIGASRDIEYDIRNDVFRPAAADAARPTTRRAGPAT